MEPVGRSETGTGSPGAAGDRTPEQQRLAELLQRVTALANEHHETAEALRHAVVEIAEAMGWPAGRALVRTGADASEFRTVAEPYVQDPSFAPVADTALADPDTPTVRQVADTGRAAWIQDVGAGDSAAAGHAREAEIRGSLAFPVVAGGDVLAVLEFLSHEEGGVGTPLLTLMDDLGRQLGLLIERNRAWEDLERVNDELERSNRELEQFAYVASHDLQEPLRKVIGFSQLLEQRYGDQLEGDAREFLELIVDGGERMRGLIDDLLKYSRAGRGRASPVATPLADVLEDAVSDLAVTLEEAGAEVSLPDAPPTVLVDPDELRTVFVNLIGNALKYRGDDPPRVTVRCESTDPGWWEVTVADNGIGIDPEQAERVFEIFQRLHGRQEYPGTGIGLAVCRRIVETLGGRIWVEPGPTTGSVFHLTLPPAGRQEAP